MKYIVIVLLVASLLLGYKIYEQKNTKVAFETGTLEIISGGKPFTVKVKIADDARERELGLMFVKEMSEDEGMIFVFEQEEMRRMWMKNTLIPLDMLFVNSYKEIFNIKENAHPQSQDIIYSIGPAKYIVELNGGFVAKHGVKEGDKINFSQN